MPNKIEIIDYLKTLKPELKRDGIGAIGLFGSFANENADKYSDIDIAVRFEDDFLANRDAWAYFEVIEKLKNMLRNRFHTGCDVFDLNASSDIAKKVEKETCYV